MYMAYKNFEESNWTIYWSSSSVSLKKENQELICNYLIDKKEFKMQKFVFKYDEAIYVLKEKNYDFEMKLSKKDKYDVYISIERWIGDVNKIFL